MSSTTIIRQRSNVDKKSDPPEDLVYNISPFPNENKGKRTKPWPPVRGGKANMPLPLVVPLAVLFIFTLLLMRTSPSSQSTFGYLVGTARNDDDDGPPKDLVVHGKRDFYTPCPPEYRKKVWTGKLKDSHVPRAFRYLGWSILEDEDEGEAGKYHIMYKRKAGKTGLTFAMGKPYQRYSRLPGSFTMESKDGFLAGFRRMQQRYNDRAQQQDGKDDLMYFIPETYRLAEKSDQNLFEATIHQDKANGRHRPWVLKKVKVNNGKGIEMIPPNSPALYSAVARSEADESNDYIVQAYICNELTWFEGEKFDLRFYWMVASVDPLVVLYHDGYVRVGGAAYNESDWGSTGQHLTNHAYRAYRGEVDEDVLADALWRRVRQHYDANKARLSKIIIGGDPVRHVRNQMKEAIGATAEAFKETMTLSDADTPPVTTENLFALYGADFIIDEDLDVYYVEAQTVPGLGDGYDFRIELFRTLLRPMINIVEEIAVKQEKDAKANILPIESLEGYDVVYAGDWRYRYEGYKRSKDKRGCKLSSSAQQMALKS
jgi:hypothetical protein